MTFPQFDRLLERRVELMRLVLSNKAKEYAVGEDRLHNFKVAACELGGNPGENAWGFLKKHLVSIRDLVLSGEKIDRAVIDEKIGDAVNYLVLLEALLVEA